MASDLKDLIFRLLPRGGAINNEDFLNNENGYLFNLTEAINFNLAGDWGGSRELIRAHQRIIHSFQFIGDCLPKNVALPDFTYTKLSKIITNWHNYFIENAPPEMVFHDETTARRVQLLLKLLINIEKNKIDFDLVTINQILKRDLDLLISDDFYAGVNNHGYFQDITLIYAAGLGYVDEGTGNKAFLRIMNYLNTVVGSDGVHKEHSPAYHYIIYNNVKANLEILEMFDKSHAIQEILNRMLPYARAIAMPNLHLPPIGDTEYKPISKNYINEFSLSEYDQDDFSYFGEGGYAIIRNKPSDYFAVFVCSHHMDYHKHRDELELILYYKDKWVLSESGPFGYDYHNFHSQYAYSNFGHNTIVVDGEQLIDRDGKVGLVKLFEPIFLDDGSLTLIGENKRIDGVTHSRVIKFSANRMKIEFTEIIKADRDISFQLRWHSQLNLYPNANGIEIDGGHFLLFDAIKEVNIKVENLCDEGGNNYRYPKMYLQERGNLIMINGGVDAEDSRIVRYSLLLN